MLARAAVFVASIGFCFCSPVGAQGISGGLEPEVVSFSNHVLPILTKAGCNSGACHGAATGRGGFRLSLYGQDPMADWTSIAREFAGRRIDWGDPEESLLLRKAGEFTDHGGGLRLEPDGHDWQTVVQWIAAGAQPDVPRTPQLRLISVQPSKLVLSHADQGRHTVGVVGQFDDGSQVDLRRYAIFQPQDESAVEITSTNQIRVLRPGRHVLIVRVRDQGTAVEIIQPHGAELVDVPKPVDEVATRINLVDRYVNERLQELRLQPGSPVDRSALLRRITLDVTGRLPTDDQLREFAELSDDVSGRSLEDWLDRLIHTPEASQYWGYWLATALQEDRLSGANGSTATARAFREYLCTQFEAGVPFAELMAQFVEGSGPVAANPAAAFYLLAKDGREQTEVFSELVLGTRIGCANCHNHPLDRWTQDDYHGLAALFAGVQRGPTVRWQAGARNIHPATGEPASIRLPDGARLPDDTDPRPALAAWIRGPGRFVVTRNWTNRVWSKLMNMALVSPVDDARITNPPTNPALLQALTEEWIQQGGDPHWLIRQVVLSRAYQRSSDHTGANQSATVQQLATQAFAIRQTAALSPEVYLDAVSDVCGVRDLDEGNANVDERFIARIPGAGRPSNGPGGRSCTASEICPADVEDTLTGRLAMIAGEIVNARLSHPQSRVRRWEEAVMTAPRKAIDAVYRACLSREATEAEEEFWANEFAEADDTSLVMEDMVWSVLTSPAFSRN